MKRGKAYFLKERLKEYAKNRDYGFLLYIVDTIRILFYGTDEDDCNGEKLFFKKERGSLFAVHNNREIHSHILNGGFEDHIINILTNQIKPGAICMDVGANIGYYSVLMADLCMPNGKVYSFEPVGYNRKKLELNASLNGNKNIQIIGKALGEKTENLELNIFPENSKLIGHNSFIENETLKENDGFEKVEVQVISADEWIKEQKIEKVDFIKVDIEGFEYNFFKGASQLLKLRPIIFFEHSSKRVRDLGINESEFNKILSNYTCYQILKDGLLEYKFNGDMHPYASDILAIPKGE